MADMPERDDTSLSAAPARWKLWLGYALIAIAALRTIGVAMITLPRDDFAAGEMLGREAAIWIAGLPIAWFMARKVRDLNAWPRPLVYGATLWLVSIMIQLGGELLGTSPTI